MKNVVLALTAVLAIGAGAAVLDAHRGRANRAAQDDQAGVEQGRGARGAFGQAPRQGRGSGGFGQGAPGRGGPGRGGRGVLGGPMLAALDLTDDQRTKIEEIQRTGREAVAPLAEALLTAQQALHRATFADQRDDAEIAKLTTTIANVEKQLLENRVKSELAVAAVLTAEQREKVRAGRGR